MTNEKRPAEILASLNTMLPELEAIYKDVHAYRVVDAGDANCRYCGESS